MARLSGIQRDVLALYRSSLRMIKTKPKVSSIPVVQHPFPRGIVLINECVGFPGEFSRVHQVRINPPPSPWEIQRVCDLLTLRARREFRQHLAINKKDFTTVEHLLRVGQRKLEMYSQPGVRNISL